MARQNMTSEQRESVNRKAQKRYQCKNPEERDSRNRKKRASHFGTSKEAEARADASVLGVIAAVEAPIAAVDEYKQEKAKAASDDELQQEEAKVATDAALEAAVVVPVYIRNLYTSRRR